MSISKDKEYCSQERSRKRMQKTFKSWRMFIRFVRCCFNNTTWTSTHAIMTAMVGMKARWEAVEKKVQHGGRPKREGMKGQIKWSYTLYKYMKSSKIKCINQLNDPKLKLIFVVWPCFWFKLSSFSYIVLRHHGKHLFLPFSFYLVSSCLYQYFNQNSLILPIEECSSEIQQWKKSQEKSLQHCVQNVHKFSKLTYIFNNDNEYL